MMSDEDDSSKKPVDREAIHMFQRMRTAVCLTATVAILISTIWTNSHEKGRRNQ
jgi:hypothetical protein